MKRRGWLLVFGALALAAPVDAATAVSSSDVRTMILSTANGRAAGMASVDRYARDIAAEASDLETAAALVTIANFEGGFRRDVETCVVLGDQGRAFTLYQLHGHHFGSRTPADACADNRVATRIAAGVVGRLRRAIGNWRDTFARYAGSPKPDDPRVVLRHDLFCRLLGSDTP